MSVAQHFADAFQEKLKVEQDAIVCEYDEKPDVQDERGIKVKACNYAAFFERSN
jgi:hypothetical protein